MSTLTKRTIDTQEVNSDAIDYNTIAPERRAFQTQHHNALISIITAMIRVIAMWSYFLTTVSILWILLPITLLHPLCRKFNMHPRNLPFDVVIRYWSRIGLFVAGIRADVHVHPSVYQLTNCVVVVNHSSSIDGFSVVGFAPFGSKWIFKRELLWQVGYFFLIGYFSGHIPVNRASGAVESLNRALPQVIKDKRTIAFFPEGTRSKNGRLLPFKKGAFHVAKTMGVPIAPVILPNNYDLFPVNKFYPIPGTINVRCLKPIPVDESTDVDELALKTRKLFVEALQEDNYPTRTTNLYVGTLPAVIWLVFLYWALTTLYSFIWA